MRFVYNKEADGSLYIANPFEVLKHGENKEEIERKIKRSRKKVQRIGLRNPLDQLLLRTKPQAQRKTQNPHQPIMTTVR